VQRRHHYVFDDWVMDSGAYSAFASGKIIDLNEYIEACKFLLATDPKLTEVFALDVIGDSAATLKNTERMWSEGVPAVPTFHMGGDESYLLHIAKEYPKIAFGGMAGARGKKKVDWCLWAFGLCWPKRVHGFAAGSRDVVMACPWDSVDTTSWEVAPTARGRWKAFGSKQVSLRGRYSIEAEVDFYRRLEQEAQGRWDRVLQAVS
jgi:hypothetical protein